MRIGITQICKETDYFSRESFDAEFQELIDLLPKPDDDQKNETYNKAIVWLRKLSDKRERWAARWTWQHHNSGGAYLVFFAFTVCM